MEDHQAQQWHSNPPEKQEPLPADHNNKSEPDRIEPVRSRWTPKPEQILILESIFNSGMVNPPKDETVRIRKLLEKFGSVGDANVFYWFQNRRSRSRRRQRQMQAASLGGGEHGGTQKTSVEGTYGGGGGGGDGIHQYGSGGGACSSSSGFLGFMSNSHNNNNTNMLNSMNIQLSSSGCSSSNCGVMESLGCVDHHDIFSFPGQMGHPEIIEQASSVSLLNPSDSINFQYQPGLITVFINGVATEVAKGPLDIKTMLGQDFLLIHSSGLPMPVNEYGFLMESLHHGESYYVVPRPF